ncbi:MAG TPA: hypothetical protein VHC63_10210 [Acidimicrobiales bacterium]|nr:hypothetical protein [Acidimicrobiales bacterium]
MFIAVVAVGCSSGNSPSRSRTFGRSGDQLVLTPTSAAHHVSHAAAKRILDHPFTMPASSKPEVLYEGLVKLHSQGATDMTGSGTNLNHRVVAISTLEGRVVWVRVSRVTKGVVFSCPMEPAGATTIAHRDVSPTFFAVVVDASTGDEADWVETLSGNPCS